MAATRTNEREAQKYNVEKGKQVTSSEEYQKRLRAIIKSFKEQDQSCLLAGSCGVTVSILSDDAQ